ncbi:MAG: hypothetical protein AB7O59_05300 [Pirellulales bacterium]
MSRPEFKSTGRLPKLQRQHYAAALANARRPGSQASKRVRGVQRNEMLPFVPPEDWHEPTGKQSGYRILVQEPGPGFRHILTPSDIRARLSQFPDKTLANLEVVQFSRMTRKKQSFPCYGMQWGSSLYLYPIETNLVEIYHVPPTPNQQNEARMYGGRWVQESARVWRLEWTEETVRDFYLNNILIHELGHLVDDRNTSYAAREQYAEWFALAYGYPRSLARSRPRKVSRRHDKSGTRLTA